MALIIKKYRNNNKHNQAYGKTYGRAVMIDTVGIEELATTMQDNCTLKRADILAVLSELGPAMKTVLQKSMRVNIPYLGTFKLSVSTKGEVNEEDFDVRRNVKSVRVIYQPVAKVDGGHRVKDMISGVKFKELAANMNIVDDGDDTGNTGTGGGTQEESPIENRP